MTDAPPSDYRLAVPGGWFRIALDPALWEKRVDALVEERFRGIDNAPHLKRELRDRLVAQAASSYAAGGTELYLSMMSVGEVPLAASLVVFYVPPPPGTRHPSLEQVLETLTDGEARLAELPAGTSVRHRYQRRPHPDDPEAVGVTTLVTHVSYQIPVPGTPGRLLLSFSTPMEPLADALTELFDQIARTLRWVP
jgi:hypothetical protein